MINALVEELVQRKTYLNKAEIKSIYFGGGTPSLMDENELATILSTTNQLFNVSSSAEVTLEANPDDITQEKLKFWKKLGVNRLSIGIQSFKPSDLEWMNRAHSVDEGVQCIQWAQEAGIENLTVDLMYGLPDLTLQEWKEHIERVVKMGVQHISAYCLTIEENTALSNWVKNGKIKPAGEDQQSEQFQLLQETLSQNGFHQYEISNFCIPGHEAVHNSNYWKGEHYLGIGPSAHSFNETTRSWNIANNAKYMQRTEANEPAFEVEELTSEDQFNELLLTGLRTIYGVNLDKLNTLIPLDAMFLAEINSFIEQGLMFQKKNQIYLTKLGKLQADKIASDLFRIKD